MVKGLEGKVVLITGGGSGIGQATALAFAREGSKVVISDVNADAGENTINMIEKAGGSATFIKTDVTKSADVDAMVKKAVDTYGQLDCAYNNAGIQGDPGNIAECPEENWDKVIDINVKGVWLCMKYEIRQMLKQGGGAIVNASSILGQVAVEGRAAYVSSKHAVAGLTRAAALEYAPANIRVNAICPGMTRTPFVEWVISHEDPQWEEREIARLPIGRFGVPDEQARAIVWLCSDEASFVTGTLMNVDGGYLAQ